MAVPRIILASRSKARQQMLTNAGIPYEAIPAAISETELIEQMLAMGKDEKEIAIRLSEEKAIKISRENPDNTIIGSDQILVFNNKIVQKAENTKDAKEKLKKMRGKEHVLISAVCIARRGEVIWNAYSQATMHMRNFNDEFLDDYVATAGNILTDCVGSYAFEANGAWLFERADGDIYTIMGMPLLPLLGFLKELGFRP